VQTHVIEEQVQIEGLISNRERYLTADEGEAAAKLQQQVPQVKEKTAFEFPFLNGMGEGQEVEVVGIAEDLHRHVRVGGWQDSGEVGQRLALTRVQAAGDHVG
jgi:hypothetical protein